LQFKIAVPDLVSNSYFPAVAAVELGHFKKEGLDVSVEFVSPIEKAYLALKNREVQFVAGSAHSALSCFQEWVDVKLVCALSQGMYWSLVMRSDGGLAHRDLNGLRQCSIAAAPWVGIAFRRILIESGIDPVNSGISIAPAPKSIADGVNFGLAAADALAGRTVDGFWANNMAAEVAIRRGYGSLVLDIRRGDGPPGCFDYTFASLAARADLLEQLPDIAAAAKRAIAGTLRDLSADPSRATHIARPLFPQFATDIIADLVARDVPFYNTDITNAAVDGLNRFAMNAGLAKNAKPYSELVAS
jgi:NitT/TauT family transport system substrate-binding protein